MRCQAAEYSQAKREGCPSWTQAKGACGVATPAPASKGDARLICWGEGPRANHPDPASGSAGSPPRCEGPRLGHWAGASARAPYSRREPIPSVASPKVMCPAAGRHSGGAWLRPSHCLVTPRHPWFPQAASREPPPPATPHASTSVSANDRARELSRVGYGSTAEVWRQRACRQQQAARQRAAMRHGFSRRLDEEIPSGTHLGSAGFCLRGALLGRLQLHEEELELLRGRHLRGLCGHGVDRCGLRLGNEKGKESDSSRRSDLDPDLVATRRSFCYSEYFMHC